jgi:hypothetical protein
VTTQDTTTKTVNTLTQRSIIPFTGGLIVFVYAFFWPEQYGHWLGTIVHGFRSASGI